MPKIDHLTVCIAHNVSRQSTTVSEEKAQDFASDMLSLCFFMVHDTSRGCHYNITKRKPIQFSTIAKIKINRLLPKLSWRKQIIGPLLNVSNGNIKSWGNDTTLVQPSSKVNDNLSCAMVIDDLEFTNVAWEQDVLN